jgi:rhamnulokinase
MRNKYVAVDLGAESGRVMLGELSDSGIALTEIHRFPNLQIRIHHEKGETLHWDILRLWHEIKTGLAKVSHLADQIAGIGVDVWGVDFALLDANGALVGNPVCYRDARTQGMVDAVFAKLPREKIYAITGIQTMALNTLFQLASLSVGNKGAPSPQLEITRRILFLPDLFTYWLCGTMATEYTIASTSQMLDARTRRWSPEIFAAINLDPALFPPIDMPGKKLSVRGNVLPSANEKLAAARVPVIAVGSHDTASAVVAVPGDSAKGDWRYLSSGTWSLLGAEVDQPVRTEKAAAYNITNEGGVGGKIRLLKNISGLYLLQECRRDWAGRGQEFDYAMLTALAEKAGPQGTILDLDEPGFSTPGDMPAKIAAHCAKRGITAPGDPGQFTRVILESLAASYAKVRTMLEEITAKRFTPLHIVGGGSQNHLINHLAADATGLPVLAGPVEATALGNVLTQALTVGALSSLQDARTLVARSAGIRRFDPKR